MSVGSPTLAIAFGFIAPPQSDVLEISVYCGCTREVSSFEVVLQNWGNKYGPNGTYPIVVGLDGNLSIGRGANCPLLLTCRVEAVRYQSTPYESYIKVSGRCWGERLFRRVITKTYENQKGEEIIKDLLDNYVGLSHQRAGVELVETTDTTYTRLDYKDTPVFDIIKAIAESCDKVGTIGFEFRVAPDGKFEFFPQTNKTNPVNLLERVESYEYSKEIVRVRNKIAVYGASDKSVPGDKDGWTENLVTEDGSWNTTSGVLSADNTFSVKGSASIKNTAQNLLYASSELTLDIDSLVDADLYPTLNLWLYQEATFNGNITLTLYDTNNDNATHELALGSEKWFQIQAPVGKNNAQGWQIPTQFNWHQINRLKITCWFNNSSSGSFWIDGLFFGGCPYSSLQDDPISQSNVGVRELVEVNEEFCSDLECECHGKALLANLKDAAEALTINSTVIDYGNTPILAGDKIHLLLPDIGVDSDFRVLNAQYHVAAATQTLAMTLQLGREKPLLADYVYALRNRTSHLSRYKTAKQ